jgi:hypothetical protein
MKVVIITQHIFPIQTPRAHRSTELIKEFARQGDEVTVYAVLGDYDYTAFQKETGIKIRPITVHWQIRPYSSDGFFKRHFLDKVMGKLLGRYLEFPDIELLYSVPKIVSQEADADLLISIANPHPIHWGVAKSRKQNLQNFPKKWIADCGDPYWANGKNQKPGWTFKWEKLFCEMCDCIAVPFAPAQDQYHSDYRHKIEVIPQGFAFETPKEMNSNPINKVTTFGYAGNFFTGYRDPSKFFEYLLTLNQDFKFIIYTAFTDLIDEYLLKLGDKVEVRKPVERSILLEQLKEMDFLINFENKNLPGQLPSKLIDYSIANRPILSIGSGPLDKTLLEQFFSGDYAGRYNCPNIEDYKIENVVDMFKKSTK